MDYFIAGLRREIDMAKGAKIKMKGMINVAT